MAIVVGADVKGTRLKDVVKNFLVEEGFEVIDVTKDGQDFVDVTLAVASEVNKDEQNLGIVDRKSTRLNSSHWNKSRMPSSA